MSSYRNINQMTRNTRTNDNLLTPCPNCGARCYAIMDLDEEDKCNDCRHGLPAPSRPKHNGNPEWVKGVSGNPNGRPKGSRNKNTKEIREALTKIFLDNLPRLQADLDKMKPFYRQTILEKLMKYFMPDLKISDEEAEANGTAIIRVVYGNEEADRDINNPAPNVIVEGDENYGWDSDEEIHENDTDDAEYITINDL